MLTIRTVFAAAGGIVLTIAVASTASADEKRNHSKQGVEASHGQAGALFGALPSCEVSHAAAQLPFVSGRSPFRGGRAGAAYGDIFFAGGGTSIRSSGGDGSSDARRSGGESGAQGAGAHKDPPSASRDRNDHERNEGNRGRPDPPAQETAGGTIGGGGSTGAGAGAPVAVNPEPASLLLLGTGLGSLILARRRGRNQRG